MTKIPDRIKAIARYVNRGETVADIGTDHGLLPIYLFRENICHKFILSDINEGPLKRAEINLKSLAPLLPADLRLGDGLLPYKPSSADSVVIAGLGGREIISILARDLNKTKSFPRFILQPRNAQGPLRKWLHENGFNILAESLIKEGSRFCEIIVALPLLRTVKREESWYKMMEESLSFEISPLLFNNEDPLLRDFLLTKINIETDIKEKIMNFGQFESMNRVKKCCERLKKLRSLLQQVE